jgi:hypothetical protein
MLSKVAILFVALQATLAVGRKAIIANRCNYDIWVQPVHGPQWGGLVKIPARHKWSEPLSDAPTSMKISRTSSIVPGKHTQFEYAINSNQIWYDISFVDCARGSSASNCPGHTDGLGVYANNGRCGKIECAPNSYCPTQAYYVDQPLIKLGIKEPVFTCPGAGTNFDITMKVCPRNAPVYKRGVAGRFEMEVDDDEDLPEVDAELDDTEEVAEVET